MDRDQVLRQVEEEVRALPGVIDFRYLDKTLRDDIVALESKAENNGACGGLMPFVNTGVWETLKREHVFVMVVESSIMLLEPTKDVVFISDRSGQIVGEYLTPERREEMKGRKDVVYLSEDFVFYPDVSPHGPPFFVLPPIPFHYIEKVPHVKEVTSGSISTMCDDFVRDRLGYKATKHWTHLVGFNISE